MMQKVVQEAIDAQVSPGREKAVQVAALGRLGGGEGDMSFGWDGAGGTFGYADPASGLAVAYCKNLQTMDVASAIEIVELVNR